jgi:FkbM family methyltransferase
MTRLPAIRTTLRNWVPFAVWQTVGFITRLPTYWKIDRSRSLRIRHGAAELALYVNRSISVLPPESLTAYLCWQEHGVGWNDSSAEVADFLELCRGCHGLFDIGAQTGFMSALFARSRSDARILSIEPDPQVLPLLRRAAELNRGTRTDWAIAACAVSNVIGSIKLPVSNRLCEPVHGTRDSASMDVQSTTLVELIGGNRWRPDIIKIDVESFEHEVICSSLSVFEKLKPALQLEVHWQGLEQRQRSAFDFLSPLCDIGYRGIKRRYYGFDDWRRAGKSEAVSRISLSAR